VPSLSAASFLSLLNGARWLPLGPAARWKPPPSRLFRGGRGGYNKFGEGQEFDPLIDALMKGGSRLSATLGDQTEGRVQGGGRGRC